MFTYADTAGAPCSCGSAALFPSVQILFFAFFCESGVACDCGFAALAR
jgi:hypothetical protein